MMKRIIYIITAILLLGAVAPGAQASTRQERRLVSKGNKLYTQRKYVEAASVYEQALKENPQSSSARYNLGLSQIRQVANPADTTPKNRRILDAARKNLSAVAAESLQKPGLAAKANFNLGNLEFNSQDYQKAIDYYKQALRIDPTDDNARKNLRIAQKKKQQQDQQQNKQNQDKQKQDQDKDKQKQDKQKQDQQKQPQEQKINQQTAERILQAMDNKENQTRARVSRASKGEGAGGHGRASKRW